MAAKIRYTIFLRLVLLPLLFLQMGNSSFGQKTWQVMEWKTESTLNSFLVQNMHQQYEIRAKEFSKAIRSKSAAEQYILNVRKKWQALYGPVTPQNRLRSEVTGRIEKAGYKIEKLLYESFPGHHVTANLYLPSAKGTHPAILFLCGHEDAAKATPSYQETAIQFVKNGFVVLVIDPVSQSERYQLTDKEGKPLTRGGTTEHTLLNAAANLVRMSTAAYQICDNKRGLDYLISRKEVDASRIGCMGNSGGAMQLMYLAAVEERIKVFAVCSFLMNRERSLELTGPSDGCSHIPGEGAVNLEMSDLLIAAAPRPVLVLAGRFDFIDYTGTARAFKEISSVYQVLGKPERTSLFTFDDGHGISLLKREAAVAWMQKWLGRNVPVIHIDNTDSLASEKDLSVTIEGSLARSIRSELTISDRNIEEWQIGLTRRNMFMSGDAIEVAHRIAGFLRQETNVAVTPYRAGDVVKNGKRFSKWILRREGAIPLPLLIFNSGGDIGSIKIYCDERGKATIADSVSTENVSAGQLIIMADLSGFGETADKATENDPKFWNREYRNAMLAIHTGGCLPALRTAEFQSILRFLESQFEYKGKKIEIVTSGAAGLPVLIAAVGSRNIYAISIRGCISSFEDILRDPLRHDWYSYVIPGVYDKFDVPDLISVIEKAGTVVRQVDPLIPIIKRDRQ